MRGFGRSLLGYTRSEVDAGLAAKDAALAATERALAGCRARVEDLEAVARRLSELVVDRDRRLRALNDRLAGLWAGDSRGANGSGVFEGPVQVDVGPLSDFSQLVRLQDAAGSIGATSEVSIKRFSQGRAELAMELDEPVELLRELEERSDLEFRLRSLKDDRVVLDVDDDE